jgi:hypothetical protein
MTEPRYSPPPSSKGRCSKVCLQPSCACCPKLQHCRRSCASTLRDVSSRSPSKFPHATEGTVKGYWWNRSHMDTNLIIFDLEDHIPRLPPQLAFQIQVVVETKNICRTVIDEGASTCVMSITCWRAIGSPPLTESHNTLKAFNGSGFKPYGVLPSLPITLEGKMVNVEVEVFDAPLDYNLLLGRSWIDSMHSCLHTFPHVTFPTPRKSGYCRPTGLL